MKTPTGKFAAYDLAEGSVIFRRRQFLTVEDTIYLNDSEVLITCHNRGGRQYRIRVPELTLVDVFN